MSLPMLSQLCKLAPSWEGLHRLYGGLIGKALFIISLASPLALLEHVGITLAAAPAFLSGATLVALGFIVEQLFIPAIPKAFCSREAYAASSIEKLKNNALDLSFEFFNLCNLSPATIPTLVQNAGLPSQLSTYFPFNKPTNVETLGTEKATYYASLVNYELENTRHLLLRIVLALAFFLGVFLIYKTTLISAIELMKS